tara:strand:- start:3960 stop:4607 length:648 start_codon:yes stop_codon:yes gene_type:complete
MYVRFIGLFSLSVLTACAETQEFVSQKPDIDCQKIACVALTFDDGPGPYTDTLLDYLDEYGAKATFYVVGNRVASNAGAIRRMVSEGHEIGNHSWDHTELTKLKTPLIEEQIRLTNQAVMSVVGGEPLATFRPPYGAYNTRVINSAGYPPTMWDVDTLDWKYRNPTRITRVALRARAGDIILMHDIHPTTVQAIPALLKQLSERGFVFVTLSELG